MKLSILICTMPKRKHLFDGLTASLKRQCTGPAGELVEIISNDTAISVGKKRNELLRTAAGEYTVFIDDDDEISPKYIELVLRGIETNPDCCSLKGVISFNGVNPKTFIHSINYKSYFEYNNIYFRPPNHLNVLRASIAKQFVFPEKNFGEDTDWAMQICKSGVLKTEYKIEEVLYHYRFISRKS